MQYSATFRYIDSDFEFDRLEEGVWRAEYADEDAFTTALNRMAIASSQHPVVDFPEMEVSARNTRVTVRAINGQLFYTDLHSQNRKDLKVVPVEVLRLIEGLPLEEVFREEEEKPVETYEAPKHVRGRSVNPLTRILVLLVTGILLSFCALYVWDEVSHLPRLHTAPQFIPDLSIEGEVLRKYADVYVSEYREGAMLFDLKNEGQFTRYEMWYSAERNGYVLIPIDQYEVQVGFHDGEAALLAGEIHLLTPSGDDTLVLHGVTFGRHHGSLTSIGEVLDVSRQ